MQVLANTKKGLRVLAPWPTSVELSEMIVEINNLGMGISGKSTSCVNSAALRKGRKEQAYHSPAFAPAATYAEIAMAGEDGAANGDGHGGTLGGAGCPTRPRPLTLQPYVKEQGAQARLTHYTSTVIWECK